MFFFLSEERREEIEVILVHGMKYTEFILKWSVWLFCVLKEYMNFQLVELPLNYFNFLTNQTIFKQNKNWHYFPECVDFENAKNYM